MSNPIVYLIINQYVDTYDYNVGGISYIENIEEFKCNVTNTGFPISSFSIFEFENEKIFIVFLCTGKRENDLESSKEHFYGFLSKEEVLNFINNALPERVRPVISKEPSTGVIEIYEELSSRFPSIKPMLSYLENLGDRWELGQNQENADE